MRIILCAGEHGRSVLIGDVDGEPAAGQPVRLARARMVIYWAKECGGLLGLAARGPRGRTLITSDVAATVATRWTEWVAVSDVAAAEVDAWPPC